MLLLAALCGRPLLLLPQRTACATPRGLQQGSQAFAACRAARQFCEPSLHLCKVLYRICNLAVEQYAVSSL